MTLHLSAKAAKDGTGATITGGVNFNDESGAGTGPFDLAHVVIDSTQNEILGTTAGAAVTTDVAGSLQQYLRGLVRLLASTAYDVGSGGLKIFVAGGGNANGQAVPGSSAPVVNAACGYSAAVSLTRTANATAYTAGAVVGAATGSTAALTFTGIGPSGQDIMITSVSLEIDRTAVISGETSYRLYLYNVTPPSATGDNGAWDLPSGDRASFLGYVDLGTPVDLGSTLYVKTDAVNAQIKLSSANVFGYLVTNGAYTPASATVHVITLHAVAL